MEFWQAKWNLEVEDNSATELRKSQECLSNENNETKLNEFTGDLEIWTDSDGADSDEFFVLVGDRKPDEARIQEESHAAAGRKYLFFICSFSQSVIQSIEQSIN